MCDGIDKVRRMWNGGWDVGLANGVLAPRQGIRISQVAEIDQSLHLHCINSTTINTKYHIFRPFNTHINTAACYTTRNLLYLMGRVYR